MHWLKIITVIAAKICLFIDIVLVCTTTIDTHWFVHGSPEQGDDQIN